MTENRHKMRDGIVNRSTTKTPSYAFLVRVDGKAKWHSGYRTRAAAKAARDEMRAAVRQGTYVERRRVTLNEWLTEWLDAYRGDVTASTHDSYSRVARLYVQAHPVAPVQLQALTPAQLSTHWMRLSEQGGRDGGPLSARTVRYAVAVVTKALNAAVANRLIQHNPALASSKPKGKASHRDVDAWTPEELRTLLASATGDRWHALWVLMAFTGLRRGEALALRWSDVDLDAALVHVRRAAWDVGHGTRYGPPKTEWSRRSVPLGDTAVGVLRSWRSAQAAERLAAGPAWTVDAEAGDLVFTWQDGRGVGLSYASKAFARAVTEAGVRRYSLHALRHTYATQLLRAGTPVHTVSKLLGHATATQTLNTYAHVNPGDESAAAAALDRLMSGT